MLQNLHVFTQFWQRAESLALATENDIWRQKVLRTCQFFTLLTSKFASCHNSVHFFNISTSKSGLRMVWIVHFDFETCFAPQRRALFRHLNFQKCSKAEVFFTYWLRHVLRATTECNCSSLIWPDCSASAALASLLFDIPESQIIEKTDCFATFLPFRAPGSSFFWLFLFFDVLSFFLLFSSLTLPTSAFPSALIVGILTSKLPSVIMSCNLWNLVQRNLT